MITSTREGKLFKTRKANAMKMSKAVIDSTIRSEIFSDLFRSAETEGYAYDYQKINDRQFGTIIEDAEGNRRYVRVGVIVAELREDMTADELMASEIADYNAKQAAKAERAAKRAEKAQRDKEKREAAEKEKKGE